MGVIHSTAAARLGSFVEVNAAVVISSGITRLHAL